MSIPQKADKWIVFVLAFALGVVELLRSVVPGGFTAFEWAALPLICAVVLTICYVIWSAACRLIARLMLIIPTAGNVRILANGGFLAIMLALILVPYFLPYRKTEVFLVPAKVRIQAPVSPR